MELLAPILKHSLYSFQKIPTLKKLLILFSPTSKFFSDKKSTLKKITYTFQKSFLHILG